MRANDCELCLGAQEHAIVQILKGHLREMFNIPGQTEKVRWTFSSWNTSTTCLACPRVLRRGPTCVLMSPGGFALGTPSFDLSPVGSSVCVGSCWAGIWNRRAKQSLVRIWSRVPSTLGPLKSLSGGLSSTLESKAWYKSKVCRRHCLAWRTWRTRLAWSIWCTHL